MIVLDTDPISLLQHPDSPEAEALRERLDASEDRHIVTTVVTLEEQLRAWLNVIGRQRDIEKQLLYYDRLVGFVRFFSRWQILGLSPSAVAEFQGLRRKRVRIGTSDLKIAAIVRTNGATLISRNLRDFTQVPGLRVEDWSKA